MMNRREFFTGLGVFGIIANGLGLGVATGQISVDTYVPAGRLGVGDVGELRVDYITLDGKRLAHVLELDDVEGWVRFLTDEENPRGPKVERRTGTVRVHWRA